MSARDERKGEEGVAGGDSTKLRGASEDDPIRAAVAVLETPSDMDGDPEQLAAIRRIAGSLGHEALFVAIVESGAYSVDVTRIALDALSPGTVSTRALVELVDDPQELESLRLAAARHLAAREDRWETLQASRCDPSPSFRAAIEALLSADRP